MPKVALPNLAMTFSPFAILTAEEMNDLVENIEALADGSGLANGAVAPAKWANPYAFHAYRNAAWSQTGASGKVSLDAVVFDLNSNFDSTTNYRYDVPVSGYYQLNFGVASHQVSGNGYGSYLRKNGTTTVSVGSQTISAQTTSFAINSHGSCLVQLSAGDYIELFYIGSTSNAGIPGASSTYFSGFLVSLAL